MIENNKRPTQCERIVKYLNDFGTITQFEALRDLGIMRLASRISELNKNGANIGGEMISVKNRYGENCSIKRYFLKGEKDE